MHAHVCVIALPAKLQLWSVAKTLDLLLAARRPSGPPAQTFGSDNARIDERLRL
jgi:hypothetical protein